MLSEETDDVRSTVRLATCSPGYAVLLVSRNAQVAWPLACSQDKLSSGVKGLLPSLVCRLSQNISRSSQTLMCSRILMSVCSGRSLFFKHSWSSRKEQTRRSIVEVFFFFSKLNKQTKTGQHNRNLDSPPYRKS